MPWIDPGLLNCSVYLYPSEAAAEDGERIGGSGFIAAHPLRVGRAHLIVLVTNKHVIDGGHMIARINTINGRHDIIPLDGEKWYLHRDGDDIAICPMQLSFMHQVQGVSTSHFISKQIISDYEIGPGDDVFVIGRFVNHEGKQRNLPSARFGNIAQMPWEPILMDGRPQESFLVEARSISGYSGSPVFATLPPQIEGGRFSKELLDRIRKKELKIPGVNPTRVGLPFAVGPFLLGVDYCHIRWDEPIWSRLTGRSVSDDWYVKSNTGMMGVVPAWRLMDIIEGPEMKTIIDEASEAARDAQKKATADLDVADFSKSARPPDQPSG